jgi:glycosyltransferase involved in cell wall biosynthesis
VSIVINNHNYARFLPDALDSAVDQQGKTVEVIVVDDGSTDDSREVIARYADRVVVVLQENLGQKAALNAGLAAATGDVVMFLDSDDLLEPHTATTVADVFAKEPATARVVFRLSVIDGDGRRLGTYVPSAHMPLPHGDVRARMLAFPDDLAWPSTSGNAFAAWALRRVMPLPVDDDRVNADHDLHTLIPLFGPVAALRDVGGSYRVHGRNAVARHTVDIEQSRSVLARTQRSHVALADLARRLGYPAAHPRSVTVVAHRLVSLRLGGRGHPIPNDTRWLALRDGLVAAWYRFDVPMRRRAAYAAWFIAAALGPARSLRALADATFQSLRPAKGRLWRPRTAARLPPP